MNIKRLLVSVLLCLVIARHCGAADYVFDLPQLLGPHIASAGHMVSVSLQLPTELSSIGAASLHVSGIHSAGAFYPTSDGPTGSVGASLHLQESQGLPWQRYMYFYYQLPPNSLQFNISEAIGSLSSAPSDFHKWLDGTVEFTFFVGAGNVAPTLGYSRLPEIFVEDAQLSISGEPLSVPEATTSTLVILGILSVAKLRRGIQRNDVSRSQRRGVPLDLHL
jgi:hypothetical protein